MRVGCPTIARARRRHLRAIDGAFTLTVAEEDYDVAVKHVTDCVGGQTGIRSEACSVCSDCRRQWQVHAAPGRAVVSREVPAHWQPEYLVGPGGQRRRLNGIESYESLALRSAFIGRVRVGPNTQQPKQSRAANRSVIGQLLIFVPPGWIVGIIGLSVRGSQCEGGDTHKNQ